MQNITFVFFFSSNISMFQEYVHDAKKKNENGVTNKFESYIEKKKSYINENDIVSISIKLYEKFFSLL